MVQNLVVILKEVIPLVVFIYDITSAGCTVQSHHDSYGPCLPVSPAIVQNFNGFMKTQLLLYLSLFSRVILKHLFQTTSHLKMLL